MIDYPLSMKLGQLLAAVGAAPVPEPTAVPAAPYDWRDPHYFDAPQRHRLTEILGQVAARLEEIFGRLRRGTFQVSLQSFTQHFAGDVCQRRPADRDYCLTFGPDNGPPCGFLAIPSQTAILWVTWLLGDSEVTRDAEAALSPLEESLLSDLLTAVVEAFLPPWRTSHNLRPAGAMAKGQPTVPFEQTEEVARIVFQVRPAAPEAPCEIALLLPCHRLAAAAGRTAIAAAKVSPQELSRALMEHLQEVPVTVTAVLASTTVTFQDILDLGPGDILLFDKPIQGPMELVLDGRAVFHGRPTCAEGHKAAVIV